jgi:hypothetical protein
MLGDMADGLALSSIATPLDSDALSLKLISRTDALSNGRY